MSYTLAGDRRIEYGYVKNRVKRGTGTVLDVGCGQKAHMSKFAVKSGYTVVGIDLCPVTYANPNFTLIRDDLLTYDFGDQKFDIIFNVSSIEHFGLKGRYGVEKTDTSADWRGMRKLRKLMTPDSVMYLTIPLGHDTVAEPYHRVYGNKRLPILLRGFTIVEQQYWRKVNDVDVYVGSTQNSALGTEPIIGPPNYYALGAFTLKVDE